MSKTPRILPVAGYSVPEVMAIAGIARQTELNIRLTIVWQTPEF